ncbi:U1 small nuclear ribonucleoprotein C [Daucus carota subsp. sativus]|uniref:U1 small nuclear ribonucleoprotein C n=1 Tax=Daucus carota subsp. sativus TaxID=79200 RepID=UPI0007B23A9C|nr:PREDICTED: U1 small nuclear ribonucleoprotein C-like [Daucus carota subsp. sativus]
MATPVSGIHGQLLEVTIVGCSRLKDTEWFSRQDPYVCVEYGSTKFSTRTCTDGGKNPTFQEKFVFTLIEGLRELTVVVWNSNTVTFDDLIGSGRIQLSKVLSQGYDDGSYSIQSKTGRYSGEVRVIMHFSNVSKPAKNHASSAPYAGSPVPPPSGYGYPPPASSGYGYPPPAAAAPYPAPASGYPPSPAYPAYPQNAAPYPPTPFPPPHSAAYPPTPFPPPAGYPPSQYPPPAGYPPSPFPPAQPSNQYPPAPYPGSYPPQY